MITGRGNYTEDINLPGMLHLVVVRSPEAHATITSIDTSAAKERSGVVAVLTGEDMAGDFARAAPHGLGAAGGGDQDARALAAQARRGEARGRPGGGGCGRDPARRGGRRRGRDRRVRPEARRGRPGGGARGRRRRSCGSSSAPTRRTSGPSRAATSTPALAEAEVTVEHRFVNHRTSGAPIEPRCSVAEPRGDEPHAVLHHPDPAHRALRALRHARHRRGQAACGRPRRGRRLRREAPGLRRGGAGAGARQAARAAGEVDRDALRAHDHEPPRARPDRLRDARREERRDAHRLPGADHRRPRRLPAAAHAVHPGARLPGDGRVLPHPGHRPALHGRVHEQDVPRTRSAARAGRRPPTGSS